MSTNRQVIDSLRNKLRERNADSSYSNQFLYQTLLEHAKWLIRREINGGRIYRNVNFFQTLLCQDVIETTVIDPCCPIKTNCKIYRTKNPVPDTWMDESGPVIRNITSVDNSTSFFYITASNWSNRKEDPYNGLAKNKYTFFANGYLWFPEHNPHKINIDAFFSNDISDKHDCSDKKPCLRFLDSRFFIPEWIEAEMMAKAVELLAGVSKKLPEDEQIDKNVNRKN